MSHIKDRLMQYEDEYSKYRKYDGLYGADVLDLFVNAWMPLPEPYKEV